MSILVTGVQGLIGSNAVRLLAQQGRNVVAHDIVAPPPVNVFSEVMDRVKIEIGNVSDLAHLLHVIKRNKVEGIIHCAAMRQDSTNQRPIETLMVNVIGSANMLEAARIMDLKRVIICSTSAVMGAPEDFVTPRKEEDYCLPLSGMYPVSKLMCEQLTYTYRDLYKVDAIAVRPRAVFGPGRNEFTSNAPVWQLMNKAISGQAIRYETGADSSFDFTYVKDLAKGIVQAYDCKAPRYYLYNLSSGKNTTIGQLCNAIKKAFPGLTVEVGPGMWAGMLSKGKQVDLSYRSSQRPPQDITRAREDFGFKPEWDLDRAILDWARWLKEGKYEA